jgi:hypothetical protein
MLNSAHTDVVQGGLVPPGRVHRLGVRRGDLGRSLGELADVAQQRLEALVDAGGVEVGEQADEQPLVDAEGACGGRVHAVAVAAGVEPGHVSGDRLPLGHAQRRRAAQQRLVVGQQWAGHAREHPEHVEQHRPLWRGRQVGHGNASLGQGSPLSLPRRCAVEARPARRKVSTLRTCHPGCCATDQPRRSAAGVVPATRRITRVRWLWSVKPVRAATSAIASGVCRSSWRARSTRCCIR